MEAFAKLVDTLYFTSSNLAKSAILREYLRTTSTLDKGWAIAAIAGTLNFDFFKRKLIKELVSARVDPVLFALSYDYVGEMSETVAHLWPTQSSDSKHELPTLHELISLFQHSTKQQIEVILVDLLDRMTAPQRWALIKLGTRGLRIGISARLLKKILAEYANELPQNSISTEDIERVWHGVEPPYIELFDWLEGKADKPDVSKKITFQPVMLAHPINDSELTQINARCWQAEWKYDGIRVQLVCNQNGKALFSRTGDDISTSFPDLLASIDEEQVSGVFDGELLAMQEGQINSFNQLQQRLNIKKPSNKLIQHIPVGMMVYDALFIDGIDLREEVLRERVLKLTLWFKQLLIQNSSPEKPLTKLQSTNLLTLSEPLTFNSIEDLRALREQANASDNGYIEGLMLKNSDSLYVAGRPKGQWYKWKRDAKLIDAVIMYAQRGHGKRSSFYSDYTFGCWQDDKLLPVGKAYSGFTDGELTQIDKWIRSNTIGRFGPVKEVKKELVFEVAFDSVHRSKRHKSGVALRFPRIHRIRWDKPSNEADQLSTLISMIEE
jgi:DNA ligase-1